MSGTNGGNLSGGPDNDALGGAGGNDTIDGAAGNDTIGGFGGDDSLLGGSEHDLLDGGSGADTILAGSGTDLIQDPSGNNYLSGESGADSMLGGSDIDTLDGGADADTLLGGNGSDLLIGGLGIDLLDGGPGNDSIVGGIENGDTISFASSGNSVTVSIFAEGGSGGSNVATATSAFGENDSLREFEVIGGSPWGDEITVNSAATLFFSLYVAGGGGNDTILHNSNSGTFVDYLRSDITSGVTVDLALGVAQDGAGGIDSLAGFRNVRGSDLNDTILGSGEINRFRAGLGNDYLDGREGSDIGDYLHARASVSIDLSTGFAYKTNSGVDTLVSIEEIRGGGFNDTIIGSNGDERLRGNGGRDYLVGGAGNDTVEYAAATGGVSVNLDFGRASDGQGSSDTLSGFEGILGSDYADTLIGDTFDNILLGGNDNDYLIGGAGNDTLDGGAGTNTLDGGAGDDTYYVNGWNSIFESNGGGNDLLISSVNIVNLSNNVENILLTGSASLTGTGNALNNSITGNSGNNSLYGGEGNDSLFGLGGNDFLDGGNGNDFLDGGEDQDTFLGGAGDDTLLGGAGRDRFDGNPGNNLINGGGGGDDYVSYSNGIQGSFGVSVNLITGIASNTYGGTDTLIAIRGINGSRADDTLIGSDQLSGQVGLAGYPSNGTTFWASSGSDHINGVIPTASSYYYSFTNIVANFSDHLNAKVVKSMVGTDTLTNINNIYGSSGDDVFSGSLTPAPSDRYAAIINFRGEGGNDTIYGFGQTINRADYSTATIAIQADLEAGIASDGRGGTDVLVDVRSIRGSSFNDTLFGSSEDDIFHIRTLGSHLIDGRGGSNRYNFNDHNGSSLSRDVLIDLGTTSADGGGYVGFAIKPGGIIDTLTRFNSARGQDGNDTLYGTPENDKLQGLAGDNLLDGRGGANTLEYGVGFYGTVPTHGVVVDLAAGRATNQWDGTDTIANFQGVIGTPFADSLTGSTQAETLTGGAGNDLIIGGGGRDTLDGGAGDDVILIGTTTLADIYALFAT
jgi:Ca2+-binding RTX toxin-like protein